MPKALKLLIAITLIGGLQPALAKDSIIQENAPAEFPASYVFSHADEKSRPGIVLLHGSSGGSLPSWQEAQIGTVWHF